MDEWKRSLCTPALRADSCVYPDASYLNIIFALQCPSLLQMPSEWQNTGCLWEVGIGPSKELNQNLFCLTSKTEGREHIIDLDQAVIWLIFQ